jgi:hypothetical protein
LTPYGLCLTFNVALSEDLLNYAVTSSDFHYKYFKSGYRAHYHPQVPEFPRKDSSFPCGLKIIISVLHEINELALKKNFNGYFFMIHDPYELPSSSSKRYSMYVNKGTNLKIIPQINSIDSSIAHYEPVE